LAFSVDASFEPGIWISEMKIACTGFVEVQTKTGSVAAANALLLRALVERGVEIDFFSKPSFVDPRPAIGELSGFRFVPAVNYISDGLRRRVKGVPVVGAVAARNDAENYNRLLVRRIRQEHQRRSYDLCLWMGDYARGSIPGLPTVSFVQGPPGTDARSVLRRRDEIARVCGRWQTLKWTALARLRLSRLGLPRFHHSDHFIVGSEQSRRTLSQLYGIDSLHVSVMPYPIDLRLFYPDPNAPLSETGTLRVLYLGRIVPRKRLDLFLQGAAIAIARGVDVRSTVVGRVGFVRGYDRLIKSFQFPNRLEWIQGVPRTEVAELIKRHDVLGQPSEEENFGSSVAEAQACGLPVIVGTTNGNADYLCSRDIHLADDQPKTFARALAEMGRRKRLNQLGNFTVSRRTAEEYFHVDRVVDRLMPVLKSVVVRSRGRRGYESKKALQRSGLVL
jgi:glycosyltransferase involved in cell wall biosynthesis